MANIEELVREKMQSGLHCSQTMMALSLDLRGIENPLLIRALGALGGGMSCQRTCGTLTGGVCALSSYVPRPEGAPEPTDYKPMAKELVAWFEQENGSLDCRDLVEYDRTKILAFCPGLMARTFEKVLEILEAHGFDPYEQA